MESLIHPTAIIDKAAQIDPTVAIGPNVIIEGPVCIGPGTTIMANAFLCGNTVVGANNQVHVGAIIGHWPQHFGYRGEPTGVVIGDNNTIREYVTIHRASQEGQNTVIGNGNLFMALSHVAHDARVDNNVTIANGALLAGHTWVEDQVTISGNVAVHQFTCIGRLAMIGGLSKIVKDVPPFMMADGPSEICGINVVGLRRAGFSPEMRSKIKRAYRILYRSGLSVSSAVRMIEQEMGDVEPVREILAFIGKSKRGICSHGRRETAAE